MEPSFKNPSTWLQRPNFEVTLGLAQKDGADFRRLVIDPGRSDLEVARAKHQEKQSVASQRDLAQACHVLGTQLSAFGTIQLLIEPLEEGIELMGEAAETYPSEKPVLDLQPKAWRDRAESQIALARLLAARSRGPDSVSALHGAIETFGSAAVLHGEEDTSYDRFAVGRCWNRTAHAYLRLAEKTGGRHHYLAAIDRLENEAATFRSMEATQRTVQGWARALREAARVLMALADVSGEEEHRFKARGLLAGVSGALGEDQPDA